MKEEVVDEMWIGDPLSESRSGSENGELDSEQVNYEPVGKEDGEEDGEEEESWSIVEKNSEKFSD